MQALRTRIRSVKSTRKITKAMEMIANAKLFRQRAAMEANREYAMRLRETVNEIVANNPGIDSPYMQRENLEKKITIVFCSDMGLCGA
jgi:F-type H+-transporting ATPase subunit gamma